MKMGYGFSLLGNDECVILDGLIMVAECWDKTKIPMYREDIDDLI